MPCINHGQKCSHMPFPIQPNTPNIVETTERRDHNMLVAPPWQSQAWYSAVLSICINNPLLLPYRKDLLLDTLGKTHPFIVNQTLKTGGLVGFWKSLTSKGISDKATKLISDSRRENSISFYESVWRQWADWCGKRKVDPFRCPLKFVLDYLSDLLMYIDSQYLLIMNHYMVPCWSFTIGL